MFGLFLLLLFIGTVTGGLGFLIIYILCVSFRLFINVRSRIIAIYSLYNNG